MSLKDRLKLGATGTFTDGKLGPHDEGDLRMAIFRRGEQVCIDFGTPVVWFSMPASEAKEFAQKILEAASEPTKSGHA